jgi:serine/threonine-protein kinase
MGIIHGDLKPANVLISSSYEPYLNDFYNAAGRSFERIHLPEGTPRYMSPEQAAGKFIGYHSDIYSFGVLIYELLSGTLPYPPARTVTMRGIVEAIVKNEITPLPEKGGKFSRNLNTILMKMLALEPDKRYSSMKVAASELKICMENRGK